MKSNAKTCVFNTTKPGLEKQNFPGGPQKFWSWKIETNQPLWSWMVSETRKQNDFSFLPLRKNLFQSGSKLRSKHKNVFETFWMRCVAGENFESFWLNFINFSSVNLYNLLPAQSAGGVALTWNKVISETPPVIFFPTGQIFFIRKRVAGSKFVFLTPSYYQLSFTVTVSPTYPQ